MGCWKEEVVVGDWIEDLARKMWSLVLGDSGGDERGDKRIHVEMSPRAPSTLQWPLRRCPCTPSRPFTLFIRYQSQPDIDIRMNLSETRLTLSLSSSRRLSLFSLRISSPSLGFPLALTGTEKDIYRSPPKRYRHLLWRSVTSCLARDRW